MLKIHSLVQVPQIATLLNDIRADVTVTPKSDSATSCAHDYACDLSPVISSPLEKPQRTDVSQGTLLYKGESDLPEINLGWILKQGISNHLHIYHQ